MVEIDEIKRDESLDYLKILRALNEIPFPVGRNLLIDFLNGKYKNSSVKNNNLDELINFGSLLWDKGDINLWIDKLISKKMIEQSCIGNNHFRRVLKITLKGLNEIVKPTLNSISNLEKNVSVEITEKDKENFLIYEDFLRALNDFQKKAVISDKKRILTIAGAGSGKTSVLVKRIEFLVNNQGVRPEEILAITFTRKAKQEMEDRLRLRNVAGVNVSTFNSFSENILRKNSREIYGRNIRVMSYADKLLALNIALYSMNLEIDDAIKIYFSDFQRKNNPKEKLHNIFLNDCFSLIDYFKTSNIEFYDFSKDALTENKEMAVFVYNVVRYLLEHKKTQGLRSFSDQLVDCVSAFKRNPSIIPYYEHVLVDEYQDVNSVQVELLKLINFDNLFCVGDPRQAIFGWRGSDLRFILNFEEDFGEAEIIHLTKNYRSSKKIVDFMNKSISHMDLPDLDSFYEGDCDIKLFNFENEEAEITFIFEVLDSILRRGEDVFILARTNRLVTLISNKLKLMNIPHILKTDDFFNGTVDEKSQLTLATVHSIKGLEANNVFLVGANKENFPCRASDHPIVELIKDDFYDKFEEEKRLFYVAISRAKKNLYITYSGHKTDFITKEMEEFV
jgi:superfamily I DNA/RNA helicase